MKNWVIYFSRLDPESLQECFLSWVQSLLTKKNGEVIALDGKTLRRSYLSGERKRGAIYMVSAWASSNR